MSRRRSSAGEDAEDVAFMLSMAGLFLLSLLSVQVVGLVLVLAMLPAGRPAVVARPAPTAAAVAVPTVYRVGLPLVVHGPDPTATEMPTQTPTVVATATQLPTATAGATWTPVPTWTPMPVVVPVQPTWTPAATLTWTPTATETPTAVPTATWTPMPTPTLTGWWVERNGFVFTSACPCDQGNVFNCDDFGTGMDAQACYMRCMDLAGQDVHELDRDGDGDACEWSW